MFRTAIKEAAKAKGVKTYYALGLRLNPKGVRSAKFEMMAKRLWDPKHKPKIESLLMVCDALDCELSDLIVRNGKRKRK